VTQYGSLWVFPANYDDIASRMEAGYPDPIGVLFVGFYGASVLSQPSDELVFRTVPLEGPFDYCARDLLNAIPEIASNERTFVEYRNAHVVFDETSDPDVVHVANYYTEAAARNPSERQDDFVETVTVPRQAAILSILDGTELVYRIAEDAYDPDAERAEFDDLSENPDWGQFKDTLDEMKAAHYHSE